MPLPSRQKFILIPSQHSLGLTIPGAPQITMHTSERHGRLKLTPNKDWHVMYTQYCMRIVNGTATNFTDEEQCDAALVGDWMDFCECKCDVARIVPDAPDTSGTFREQMRAAGHTA